MLTSSLPYIHAQPLPSATTFSPSARSLKERPACSEMLQLLQQHWNGTKMPLAAAEHGGCPWVAVWGSWKRKEGPRAGGRAPVKRRVPWKRGMETCQSPTCKAALDGCLCNKGEAAPGTAAGRGSSLSSHLCNLTWGEGESRPESEAIYHREANF